ncbi:CTU1 protein, partial [Rhabdornis inornatus]|nr:CTU1 protein [Rhabdornis inornatus]
GHAVAVAASGGKDSTVLAHLLVRLNRERGLGLRLALLGVDEGIWGYRDEALGVLRGVGAALPLPLLLVSHREIFGWALDELGPALGGRSRCTWSLPLPPGHNADDVAETVLMNFLRGDVARLRRAANEASGATNGATGATNLTGATKEASGATMATDEVTVATNEVTAATNEVTMATVR